MPDPEVRDAVADSLRGRRAVVTGSSGGIGRAIALRLARAGADVLVHGRRNRQGAEQVASLVRDAGSRSHVILSDIADAQQRSQLVEQAWEWAERVDIWVNNAGADVLTGEMQSADFFDKLEQVWRVDVVGTIALSRQVGARMAVGAAARSRPTILNIGWDQAQQGMGGDSGEMFAASKGAVMAFTRSLARSLAPRVRVNCLAPGWIKTDWGRQASDYWQRRAERESLLGRWGTAEDVAETACFLVSPAAGFINGQVIALNGGFRHAEDAIDDA